MGTPFAIDHRPWPLPSARWLQAQSWQGLLFAHWPIAAERLRAVVPSALPLDTFEGQAWVAIVPFYLGGLHARGVPSLPGLSGFAELNMRTYVSVGGRPGVFFFSLDAGNPLAVAAARLIHLPYFYAWMRCRRQGDEVSFASRRLAPGPLGARFRARYRPSGPPYVPHPGTLAHFLTERYCLYTADRRGRTARLEIHHPPWPLQDAEAEIELNTIADAAGLPLPDTAPLLHYSARQDMVAWSPRAL